MTTKPSNASAINTVKSAPSGLDQIQPTVSTPQQPTLLMKSFSGSVVQVPPSTTIQKSSAAWTPGQRPAQAPAPGLSGHAGSEKGNRVHMPSTATVFSQQFPQLDRGSQTGFTKTSSTGVKTATTMTAPPVTVTPAQQSGGTEMEAFILELEKVSNHLHLFGSSDLGSGLWRFWLSFICKLGRSLSPCCHLRRMISGHHLHTLCKFLYSPPP